MILIWRHITHCWQHFPNTDGTVISWWSDSCSKSKKGPHFVWYLYKAQSWGQHKSCAAAISTSCLQHAAHPWANHSDSQKVSAHWWSVNPVHKSNYRTHRKQILYYGKPCKELWNAETLVCQRKFSLRIFSINNWFISGLQVKKKSKLLIKTRAASWNHEI